jgi:ATP-dependent Clp protease ATP-binding subunit ClpC
MWQRFSQTSRHAILKAEQSAFLMRSSKVETEHLLLSLMDEPSSASTQILQNFGVTAEKVRPVSDVIDESVQKQQQLSAIEVESLRARFKVDPELIRHLERELLRKLQAQSKRPHLEISTQVKRVLELAADEARRTQKLVKHSNYIGPEHLLLGLLRDEDSSAARILHNLGLSLEQTRIAVVEYLKSTNQQ